MTTEQRQHYIDWLLLSYPFKAEEYFTKMDDQTPLREFERLNEIM